MPTQAWEDPKTKETKVKIAVAIPYNGDFKLEWVTKTFVPLWYVFNNTFDKAPFMCKVPSISVARDTLVKNALDINADYIFFVDTDIIFESPSDPNIALKLLYDVINKDKNPNSKDAKIVSGLYRSKKKEGFDYAMWRKTNPKGYIPIESWTGNWLEADVTGLGCTLIDMEVFKELTPPWFYWERNDDISEDFYFFELAKKAGYNLKVFTEVKLSHLANTKIKCDGSVVLQEL